MMRWALEILSRFRVDLAGSFINDSSINGGENAPVPLLGMWLKAIGDAA